MLNPNKPGFEESNDIRRILDPVCAKYAITLRDSDDYGLPESINEKILSALLESDVIFADANQCNENIWYEIGYADRINMSKVIVLSKEDRDLPFDRAHIRSIKYQQTNGAAELVGSVERAIKETLITNTIIRTLTEKKNIISGEVAARQIAKALNNALLRQAGVDWLKGAVLNDEMAEDEREVCLRALEYANCDNGELLIAASMPHVDNRFRKLIFARLNESKEVVDPLVWENSLQGFFGDEDITPQIESIIYHRLNGAIGSTWFESFVLRCSNPKVKEAMFLVAGRFLAKRGNNMEKMLIIKAIGPVDNADR